MLAFWVVLVVSGCRSPDFTIGSSGRELIRSGQAVLVGFRLNIPQKTTTSPTYPSVEIAEMDSGSSFKEAWPVRSPSRPALDAGWRTLILRPGRYLMIMSLPEYRNKRVSLSRMDQQHPSLLLSTDPYIGTSLSLSFRFDVPAGNPALYLGDICFQLEADPVPSPKPNEPLLYLTRVTVESTLESKAELAGYLESTPEAIGFSPLVFFPVENYDKVSHKEWMIIPGNKHTVFKSRDWSNRSMARFSGFDDPGKPRVDPSLESKDSGLKLDSVGSPEILAAATMVYIGYLPFALAGGTISGLSDEAKYEPQVIDMRAKIEGLDLCRELANRTIERRSHPRPDKNPALEPPVRCELEILQINLAECSDRKTFAVEIRTAAHWYDSDTGDLVFERYFVATNRNTLARNYYFTPYSSIHWQPGLPYEQPLYSQPSHPIADLADHGIVSELIADTRNGICVIADKVANIDRDSESLGLF